MNLLFLSNPARGYYRFFNALANEFMRNGHTVVMAVDCPYSAHMNQLGKMSAEVHVFSDYFAKHACDREILSKYSRFNLNAGLLPDYERAQTSRAWGRRSNEFFDALKSALLSFYEGILREHSIDAVVFENVSDTFAYFAWYACQHNDVAYCGITTSRLPGRYTVTNDPQGESHRIAGNLEAIENGSTKVPTEVTAWCEDYIANIDKIVPDYMRFNNLDNVSLLSRFDTADKLRVWTGALRFAGGDHTHSFKVGNPLTRRAQAFRRAISRRMRARGLRRYYSEPDKADRYLLYPLHLHPEASTSVLSPTYLDEYEVIRNIAFNLPEGVKLYVKDHVSAFGVPGNAFYESIARLPNVKFIQPFAPTKELIRGSLAVVTLTSTVGYEALLLGKRVFLFGNVFYEIHENVVRVEDPSRIFELFQRWLAEPVKAGRDYNTRFIEAYYLASFPGLLDPGGPDAPELAVKLYPDIAQYLESGRMPAHSSQRSAK